MKKTTTLTALLLSALMLSSAILTSCGGAADSGTASGDPSLDTTSAASEETTEAEPVNPIEKQDYDGYEFKIFSASRDSDKPDSVDEIWTESENGDLLNDTIYKRNRSVEEVMNVKIAQAVEMTRSAKNPTQAEYVTNHLLSGDKAFEIGMFNFNVLQKMLYLEGAVMDLDDIPTLKLESEWWNQDSLDALSIAGHKLVVSGDINLRSSIATYGIIFNNKIVADLNMDSPYKFVKDGTWTLDQMNKMIQLATADINGDGEMGDDDRYGLIATSNAFRYLFNPTGEEVVIKNNDDIPVLNTSERMHTAAAAVFEVAKQRWEGDSAALTAFFLEDKGLFYQCNMGTSMNMRNMESDYGIIPAPKLDEKQDRYYCPLASSYTSLTAVPTWGNDYEMVGNVMDALGYYSKELVTPTFFEVTMSEKAARDGETIEMVKLMTDSKMFIINDIFNFGKSTSLITYKLTKTTLTFASDLATYETAVPAAVEELIKIYNK